jgi:hypothetical protein
MKGKSAGVKEGKAPVTKGLDLTKNAVGSKVFTEAKGKTGFKKGGKVEGDKAAHRLDKACRNSGGRIARASGGRSPFTEAESTSERPGFKGNSSIND